MILLLLIFLNIPIIHQDSDTAYFYFGDKNFVGVGQLENNVKVGSWSVYAGINPVEKAEVSILRLDPSLFDENYDKTQPSFILNFVNDEPEGLFQQFYKSGKIKRLSIYSEGKLNGDYFEFLEDGSLAVSGNFEKGLRNGDWKAFYPDGSEKKVMTYQKDLLIGDVKSYYLNGDLASSIPFRQGELAGEYSLYFQNGGLKENGIYNKLVLEGKFTDYYESGVQKSDGDFSKDLPNGKWNFWSESGVLEASGDFILGEKTGEWIENLEEFPNYYRRGHYVDGEKNGTWQLFGQSEITLQEEVYEKGKLISLSAFNLDGKELSSNKVRNGRGKRVFYDENGSKIASGSISKGVRSGIWYYYFPVTNQVQSKGKYKGPIKVGTWNYFSENGKEIAVEDHGNFNTAREFTPRDFGFNKFVSDNLGHSTYSLNIANYAAFYATIMF